MEKIYPVASGEHWRRRDVVVKDLGNQQKIMLKLWGEHSTATNVEVEKIVKVKNVEVREYGEVKQLNSTPETQIIVSIII